MAFNEFSEYTETLRFDELLTKADEYWDSLSDKEQDILIESGELSFWGQACKASKPGDIIELNHTTMKFGVVGHYVVPCETISETQQNMIP